MGNRSSRGLCQTVQLPTRFLKGGDKDLDSPLKNSGPVAESLFLLGMYQVRAGQKAENHFREKRFIALDSR